MTKKRFIHFTNDRGVRYVTEVPDDFPDDDYTDEQVVAMLNKARVEQGDKMLPGTT